MLSKENNVGITYDTIGVFYFAYLAMMHTLILAQCAAIDFVFMDVRKIMLR